MEQYESHPHTATDAIRAFVGVVCAASVALEPLIILSDPTYGSANEWAEANFIFAAGVAQAIKPVGRLLARAQAHNSPK